MGDKAVLADPWWGTLYLYSKDGNGISNGDAACAEEWPPVVASASDVPFESFGILDRGEGRRLWMHQGRPVYNSRRDAGRDDANEHGIDDAWFVVEIEAHDM